MMTIEEVIKQLKDLRKATLIEKNYKTFNVAIEVLEKEIPKKIYIYDYGKAHCPVCNTDVHGIGKIDFCFSCGQKLDWEA